MPITPRPYTAGALVQVQSSFTDPSQDLLDPTNVILKFQCQGQANETIYVFGPSYGLVTNPQISNPDFDLELWSYSTPTDFITKASVGIYSADLDTTSLPGIWTYLWAGRGTVGQSIQSGTFVVAPPAI
jgi:hypothetical protein